MRSFDDSRYGRELGVSMRSEVQIVSLHPPLLFRPLMLDLPRVAVLDDYQGIALKSADWSPLDGRVTIDVFREHISDEDELVEKLEPYTIICAMRERTKFPRSVLERLPNLRYARSRMTAPFH